MKKLLNRLYFLSCLMLMLGILVAAKDLYEAHTVREAAIMEVAKEVKSWNACNLTLAQLTPGRIK